MFQSPCFTVKITLGDHSSQGMFLVFPLYLLDPLIYFEITLQSWSSFGLIDLDLHLGRYLWAYIALPCRVTVLLLIVNV